MRLSSGTLSLFAEPSVSRRGPGSVFLSILAHAAIGGTIYYGVTHLPRIDYRLVERYSIRQLDLHSLHPHAAGAEADPDAADADGADQNAADSDPDSRFYPDAETRAALIASQTLKEARHSFLKSAAGRETLIQPEFDTRLAFAEQFMLPNIMIWTPELTPSKRIVPPLRDVATAANVTPSAELPNQELHLADHSVASTTQSPRIEAVPPGTTSPLAVHWAKLAEMAPTTISDSPDQPTPTALLSLSNLRMDGTVIVPPVNEIAASASQSTDTHVAITAAADDAGARRKADSASAGDRSAAGSTSHPKSEVGDEMAEGETRLTTEHIVRPKDGRFGFVVLGNSIEQEYPEILAIWGDRVAYTAYLHVGLSKTWILQYAELESGDVSDGGTVARMEAPWPFDMVRPNLLSQDLNADALMIHGILTAGGRLESLSISYPEYFQYASFVLHSLGQWHFRAARRNGQPIAVEVLLIIPREMR